MKFDLGDLMKLAAWLASEMQGTGVSDDQIEMLAITLMKKTDGKIMEVIKFE